MKNKPKLGPFHSDGCSGGMTTLWEKFTGEPPPWNNCCIEHDRAYHRGGNRSARLRADQNLRACVAAKGYPVLALLMYWAVRVFASPSLSTPWIWGYGRLDGYRGYDR